LAELHFELSKHLAYTPDLDISNYLFPTFKKHLKGRKFSSTKQDTLAVDRWFAAQPKEFSLDGLNNLKQ
jgi:hypothetical protein